MPTNPKEEQTKFVGGAIPSDLYWRFKSTSSQRHEKMGDALKHAILMYLDFPQNNKEKNNGRK